MSLFVLSENPVKNHYLTKIRDKNSSVVLFRESLYKLSLLVIYESLRLIPSRICMIDTPVATTKSSIIDSQVTGIVILRAGLSMIPALHHWVPDARVECLGMARNSKTLSPELYYNNIRSQVKGNYIIILDPLVATGGSICKTMDMFEGYCHLVVACIIAAPEGIQQIIKHNSSATIFTAHVDKELNHKGYIIPGLGDAGERFLGIT